MLKYAELRMSQNNNLLTNSCVHFAKDVVAAAGIETPWLVEPRPNSYIGEFATTIRTSTTTRERER